MKLADDFFVKLLNYNAEYERISEEQNHHTNFYVNDIHRQICNPMFILEETDFKIAIELCKEYKRSDKKRVYEHNLNQFCESVYETGTYTHTSNAGHFINELNSKLIGNRCSTDKRMLVNEDLKKHFPEREEIDSANRLLKIVSETTYVEAQFRKAQEYLEKHQAKLKSIHEGIDAGNSVLEIVEQLKQDNLD